MYRIPENFDLSPLVGEDIWSLSIGMFSIWINTETLGLRSDQGYSLILPDGYRESAEFSGTQKHDMTRLPALIGKPITRIEVVDSLALLFHFSDGATLECPAEVSNYECLDLTLSRPERFSCTAEDDFVIERSEKQLHLVF